jgi:hypothetical protein
LSFSFQKTDQKVLGDIGATVRGDFEALTIAKLPGEDRKVVKDVIKTLCRKYTHARLGGYINGEFSRTQELKGRRAKGGEGLRDVLHTVTGKRGGKVGGKGKGRAKGGAELGETSQTVTGKRGGKVKGKGRAK